MKGARRSLVNRVLLRILQARRGRVRAMQDLHNLRTVLRFAAMFAGTILIPALLLSYMALSSSRTEELSLDAELRGRADGVIGQLYNELGGIFLRFEQVTLDRLRKGESPLENLGELSPYMRAAFRFDPDGSLAAPFDAGQKRTPIPESVAYQTAVQTARIAEQRQAWIAAEEAWTHAASIAVEPMLIADARLGYARVLQKSGRDREAEQAFADLYGDFANVRDPIGFRIADLALLKRGEIAMERQREVGAVVLQALVDDLLATRWTIGQPGEATVARRALVLLDGLVDPDWLARSRTQLKQRSEQLFWADIVADELEQFSTASSWATPGEYTYYVRPESPTVWATVRADHLYAFSFSRWDLVNDLSIVAQRVNAVDGDLLVRVLRAGEAVPENTLASRSLGPWMPSLTVVVVPNDAEALVVKKSQRRRARLIIIFLSVLFVFVGVALSARIISQEMESARMKADFAANVSHELRSPITQIRLKGESLQLDLVLDEEDRQAHYDAIVREAERLSRLVDNVLDFSSIERGVKTYSLRREDLISLIYNTADSAAYVVEKAGLRLELDVPDDLPPVWIDREAMSQVLVNLISNAVKYGADGGVVIVQARAGIDNVEMSVIDKGMGIAPGDLDKVFDNFYRASDTKVRRKKGTGIGLSIVRYIVEAHHGTITVDSTLGEGTTFTVFLPLDPPEEDEI